MHHHWIIGWLHANTKNIGYIMKNNIEYKQIAENTQKKLLKYGLSSKQASGIAGIFRDMEQVYHKKFIYKDALDDLIKHHFMRFESKIHSTKFEMLKWYVIINIFQTTTIIAVVILIISLCP